MNFTHLHVHTGYSLLDGLGKIKDMVRRAKALGMDSLAITDHGVMYGAIDFYNACLEEGIKPIIGCEVYVAPGSRFDKKGSASDERYYHLILLAENNKGYNNLIKIVSKGFTEGFYYKPRIDRELLEEYHEGIICTSACLAGEVASNILKGLYDDAKEAALYHERVFGKGNYFLEMQDHKLPEQREVNKAIMRMHQETGIPIICTNDIHYVDKNDYEAHDILLCIQTGKKVSDEDRMRYQEGEFYMRSPEEMAELFSYAPEALENTYEIAKRCNVTFKFNEYKLPKFDVPGGLTAEEYLISRCKEGLAKRYPEVTPELEARLDHEIGIIKNMGFVDYFLIVQDYINYAKTHGISVGPGRGSAAGSLVSYCLGITELDPIRYQLLFERFLNPGRVSMPDIDVDFEPEGRQAVIDYVVEKYGQECVSQIITFGTMAARNSVRDVGRVLDIPYAKCDTVAKAIPQDIGMTIEKALTVSPELRELYDSDPEVKNLIEISKKVEGLPRHTSIHAAGVVISDAPIEEYVPLQTSADNNLTTQYVATTLEKLGLLKMDFLGLRNLTVIQNAVKYIRQTEPDFDIEKIPYDDPKVFELISSGKCDGIFQLESAGMKAFMKELKPENLEDVIAGISLYRPGPMDFIPKYIAGKNNRDSIEYDCPELVPILEPTYGCIVYQEQVMQIVRDLAGYSLAESDDLRRAMSKKKESVIAAGRTKFIYGDPSKNIPGCVANGINAETANKIYDEMYDFAKYAFNKSHAASYAVITYQTAYLKRFYPAPYMASLISSVAGNLGKVGIYIQDMKSMGIKLLAPDINKGQSDFSVHDGDIYYGLSAIKGIGRPVTEAIIKEREEHGEFKDLRDFADRLSGREVNKRAVENLIKAGAFDSIPGSRRQLMMVYPQVMDEIAAEKKKNLTGQTSLFDLFEPGDVDNPGTIVYPDIEEYSKAEILAMEKEVLGIYVSGHPLEDYTDIMKKNATRYAADFELDEITDMPAVENNEVVVIGGMVEAANTKLTRRNEQMCYVTLEDLTGSVEVLVFPRDYANYRQALVPGNKVFITGRVSLEENKPAKLICTKVVSFSEVPKILWIKYDSIDSRHSDELELNRHIAEHKGSDRVILYAVAEKKIANLPDSLRVNADDDTVAYFKGIYGDENVSVTYDKIK